MQFDTIAKQAKTYLDKNQLNEAKPLLEQMIELQPNIPELHNNYGSILLKLHDHQAAEKQFQTALELKSNYLPAMYNLALALHAQKKTEEAIASLLAILSIDPKNIRANFMLGKLLLEEKVYDDANQYFATIAAENTDDADVLQNIIQALLENDRYKEAKPYCEHLLKSQPDNPALLYNLGIIETRLSNHPRAINYYCESLKQKPDYFPTLNNLAVLYLEEGNIEKAKYFFEEALSINPNNESIQYTLGALEGKSELKVAPNDYLKNLFDGYAERFEQHLSESLEYKVPETLQALLEPYRPKENNWRILDLGCGTGLCGSRLKPWASTLIGIDLSPKMIEEARKKHCYDELEAIENVEYLSQHKNAFDLIVAADVFVYQGDLTSIFQAAHEALVDHGLFAFTTEIHDGEQFALEKTGRFSHAKSYIESLANSIGFEVLVFEIKDTRTQRDEQVKGQYFILRKTL